MSEVKISAELRTEFGKGGARRTRRAGKVPAVLYGHGEAPRHIALPAREFAAAIRHGGANQIFNISLADGTETLAGALRQSMAALGARDIAAMQQVEIVHAPAVGVERKSWQRSGR